MGEAERRNAKINGVISIGPSTMKNVIEHWKDEIKKYEESPNNLGVCKTVEFEDHIEDGYVSYWAY